MTLFLLFFRGVRLRLGPRRAHEKGILLISVLKGILFINVLNGKRSCCSFSHNGDAHARVYVRPCFDIVPKGRCFSRRLIRDVPGALPGLLDFKLLAIPYSLASMVRQELGGTVANGRTVAVGGCAGQVGLLTWCRNIVPSAEASLR